MSDGFNAIHGFWFAIKYRLRIKSPVFATIGKPVPASSFMPGAATSVTFPAGISAMCGRAVPACRCGPLADVAAGMGTLGLGCAALAI